MTNGLDTIEAAPQSEAPPVIGMAGLVEPLPVGRRERQHGALRTVVDIHLTAVHETATDLAVADRVAYVIARRTGTTLAVVATHDAFLVAACDVELDLADVHRIQHDGTRPRIVSIATSEGVAPLLDPIRIT